MLFVINFSDKAFSLKVNLKRKKKFFTKNFSKKEIIPNSMKILRRNAEK